MNLTGVITAVVTPFKNGEVDLDSLIHNIQFQINSGVAGILPLGTTGESPTLTQAEKVNIIKATVAAVKNKTHIMVGTGSNSTAQTIESNKIAEDLGADSVLIVAPYYNKPTQTGILKHYEAIAEKCNLPIVVYNIQGRTGINIETSTMKKLSEIDNIIGVKEASGNINQISEVIAELQSDKFTVWSGDDSLTLPVLALGGKGIISVVSNLIPKELVELCNAGLAGDFTSARKIHQKYLSLFKVAFIETNPAPIKTAMELCGMPAGNCRLPLCDISDNSLSQLKSVLNKLQLC